MTETGSVEQGSWLDRVLRSGFKVDRATLVMAVLVILAVASRFYDVGARVMSHDETTHVYYSWNLYQGRGFQHNPLMHGPMQFHLWALSYFLFGDNDTAARIPTSVMGVAAVALTFALRRWLGRTGSLVAGALMLISPYMLFYSRYTREDPFVVPEALLMFWAIFAYFDTRKPRWLYLLAISLVLHFATKETAFIYAAQLLLFLAAYLGGDLLRQRWERPGLRLAFLGGAVTAILGLGMAGYIFLRDRAEASALMAPTPVSEEATALPALPPSPLLLAGAVIAIIGAGLIVGSLVLAFGRRLRTDFPALDLLIVTGTLTLPQLGAMIAHILGWNPIDYTDATVVSKDAVVVVLLFAVSALIGLAWDWRRWLIAASSFWAVFLVLYTTVFTNGFGFLTGLVGSLGYWLEQQPVQRGGQPWFYYAFIQVPVYEYLPAIGVFLALVIGAGAWLRSLRGAAAAPADSRADTQADMQSGAFPVPFFLGYWVISSLVAYSYAGEKMPWLTVHIALPMILLAGWAFGRLLEGIDWRRMWNGRTWLDLAAIVVLIVALLTSLGDLLGVQRPFQGTTMDQLQATTGFLVSLLAVVGAGAYLVLRRAEGLSRERWQLAGVVALALLGVLTARAAFRAAFVNYDLATEYLVYAHGAPGVNVVMETIDDLATRTADGGGLDVAYDDQTSYPFMWYLRNYPRVHFFGGSPSRDLLNSPVVIVGAGNWSKVEPILGKRYYAFELHRLWWPNQDYWRIGWSSLESEHNSEQLTAGVPTTPMSTLEYLRRVGARLSPFFTDPAVRHAVWEIWINRDFSEWAALNNSDLSVQNWNPTDKMKLYVRKDVAALLWDYGVTAAALDPASLEDPYAKGMIKLPAQAIVGAAGAEPGLFNAPRNIAVARDGSLYVADTFNHRIQHLAPDGTILQVWGSYADASQTEAPGGTFNEPWGVAVAPDGTVYVADTWNHRVQRFTSTGSFLSMFGTFGQAESLTDFWGPRGVAVDRRGRVFVADTGNKRIAVFDSRGQGLTAFGEVGFGPGQLDEPVGVAVDSGGQVYVADTWNQRIQVFSEASDGVFGYDREWPIDAWYGQSLDNKPFLAAGPGDRVCATDPEAFRVLCFKSDGTFEFGWGEYGAGADQVGLLGGLAFGPQGSVWVADAGNARVMEFVPAPTE